jgi:hypothetical protein
MRDDKAREIAPDLVCGQVAIVNVVFDGRPGAGDGLIDTRMPGAAFDLS